MVTFLKTLALIKEGLKAVVYLIRAVKKYLDDKRQKETQERLEKIKAKVKEAEKITDDTERIKAKAQAACELEKVFNPQSHCDKPHGL